MPKTGLLAVYRTFPKEIFRTNNGCSVRLRCRGPERRIYDIVADNGVVHPKARDPSTYVAPNGASMRPNTPYQQSQVSWRFKGNDIVVFAIPKGTALPDELLLVHERGDHYSLQPGIQMSINDLNGRITRFLNAAGELFTKEEWLRAYPKATEKR